MKAKNILRNTVLLVVMLAAIIAGLLVNGDLGKYDPESDLRLLGGKSEFFYKPKGDTRVWHIINTYSSQFSNGSPEHNVSEYLFTSDSVFVKNIYVGIDPPFKPFQGDKALDHNKSLTNK